MNKYIAAIFFATVPAGFWGIITSLIIGPEFGSIVALVFVLAGLDVCLRPNAKEREMIDAIERIEGSRS